MTPGSARSPCLLSKISHGVHGQFYTCCVEERKEEEEGKRDEGCFSHFFAENIPIYADAGNTWSSFCVWNAELLLCFSGWVGGYCLHECRKHAKRLYVCAFVCCCCCFFFCFFFFFFAGGGGGGSGWTGSVSWLEGRETIIMGEFCPLSVLTFNFR